MGRGLEDQVQPHEDKPPRRPRMEASFNLPLVLPQEVCREGEAVTVIQEPTEQDVAFVVALRMAIAACKQLQAQDP